ncbi:SPW repeat domain-containing protein [Chryseobacterium gossypii]|uniref:SPW repeat domain-containing protein n=1 Tax=Chryseobacterium gossypii TaxID=3231602 RepID=UPI003524AA68
MISTKTHAVLDYLMGALLIAIPWLLGFADNSAATVLPVILGGSTLVYSLLTDYEYALAPVFPFKAHLTIDFMAGLLLLVSPWLFGFSDRIFWPHVILGAFEIMAVLLTRKTSVTQPKHV